MQYAFLLKPHANTRYLDSLRKLAIKELKCMLKAGCVDAEPAWREMGGAPWLIMDCPPLSDACLRLISRHSSIYLGALLEGDLLRPLAWECTEFLPADIAEVLKYKGKTNASFTELLLNCALCASAFAFSQTPLQVMDPLCGKGTSLFCALRRGYDAIGVEMNAKDIHEANDYFSRYLQLHRMKHQKKCGSFTLPGGKNAPLTSYQVTGPNDGSPLQNVHTLRFIEGDTLSCPYIQKPETIHLMIADLPYGVQHAPQDGRRIASFPALMAQALPKWYALLHKGGAIALSFNELTLKKTMLQDLMQNAGFNVQMNSPFEDFSHWVEQAVTRDILVAVKE